jgi:predicted DNA-binding protein (UPF0251 family)
LVLTEQLSDNLANMRVFDYLEISSKNASERMNIDDDTEYTAQVNARGVMGAGGIATQPLTQTRARYPAVFGF